ncbi:hypothetical protein FOMPIDRAFT_1024788 [Fomitopsis schrenkii]|uniref:Uncharacterized protein n=1 Tax=Fomitopsis schrenkii TaxID=2126942 RepID=S8FI55_FOMSC|nr:hypothetical protein FOMPIDRAFT_1024788 [Fomitopsis schrenkii]
MRVRCAVVSAQLAPNPGALHFHGSGAPRTSTQSPSAAGVDAELRLRLPALRHFGRITAAL